MKNNKTFPPIRGTFCGLRIFVKKVSLRISIDNFSLLEGCDEDSPCQSSVVEVMDTSFTIDFSIVSFALPMKLACRSLGRENLGRLSDP